MTSTPYRLSALPGSPDGETVVNATLLREVVDSQDRTPERLPPEEPLPDRLTTLAIVELILKRPQALHGLLSSTQHHSELLTRLLAISIAGFTLFGIIFAGVLFTAGVTPQLTSLADKVENPSLHLISFESTGHTAGMWDSIRHGNAPAMIFAYTFGLIAATGICLPSLYFYGLLAGVRMSWLEVVLHSLRAKATAAIALVGIVPVYLAAVLGVLLFDVPPILTTAMFWAGCLLPFVAGLWGTTTLYDGFVSLGDNISGADRCQRACFLRRLVISWCLVYTAVGPVMIHSVWTTLTT